MARDKVVSRREGEGKRVARFFQEGRKGKKKKKKKKKKKPNTIRPSNLRTEGFASKKREEGGLRLARFSLKKRKKKAERTHIGFQIK